MTLQAQSKSGTDDWDEDDKGITQKALKTTTRRRDSSFSSVVSDLEVGESASRTHFLNPDMTLAKMHEEMREMKSMIANNARPAITAAKQRTGGEYRIETGETITTAGRVYLLVIITRIA
jgi:hypothetical protein